MAIENTDYFLIEGNDGPKKIQASVLKDGLTTTYADYYMLANDENWSSCKFKCSQMLDKLPDPANDTTLYYLLLNRVDDEGNWIPYKVNSNIVRGYFQTAFAEIWSDYFYTPSYNWTQPTQSTGVLDQATGGFDGLLEPNPERVARALNCEGTGWRWAPPGGIACNELVIYAYSDNDNSNITVCYQVNEGTGSTNYTYVHPNAQTVVPLRHTLASGRLNNIAFTNSSPSGACNSPEGNFSGCGFVGIEIDGELLIDGVPRRRNLIPDNWTQEQRRAAMEELIREYNENYEQESN